MLGAEGTSGDRCAQCNSLQLRGLPPHVEPQDGEEEAAGETVRAVRNRLVMGRVRLNHLHAVALRHQIC